MAIVRKLEKLDMERDSTHTEVQSTYSKINCVDGFYLKVDTYGSKVQQEQGKKESVNSLLTRCNKTIEENHRK